MENFVKNIKQDIEVEIQRIEQQDIDILDKIKQIVGFIQTSLARLKATIADYQFINPEEEILFFKVRKPQISGLLIFYIRLYQIERNRIGKSPSAQYKYLKEEYESLKNISSDKNFYNYYQAGKTDSDHLYFMRKHYDILSDVHCHSLDRDTSFSTLHDSSVAEILANKQLTHYLSTEIDALSEKLHLKFTSIIESKLLTYLFCRTGRNEHTFSDVILGLQEGWQHWLLWHSNYCKAMDRLTTSRLYCLSCLIGL